jgi:outer membrane receptor protein involved in Fe transport
MTRSRRRKLLREAGKRRLIVRTGIPVASALLASAPALYAQEQGAAGAETGGLQEVVVTAQKRSENLQTVPIAVQVFDTQKLEQLRVSNIDDYVMFAPSVNIMRGIGQGGNGQPGIAHVYIRGVASGGEGNHSGPQPTVGTYLDEQPVTTIDGALDVHIYDIARIEVLKGPQGTLYGASSESGTVRIITNKPDPGKFSAGYDLIGNTVDHGGNGYELDGFVNIPLGSSAAVRLVGFYKRDAGYIDNVAGTNENACIQNGIRTFPTWSTGSPPANPGYPYTIAPCPAPAPVGAGAITAAPWLKNDYNTVDTSGGRAALRLDLNENWTVTPTFMAQRVSTDGFFGFDPGIGDLQVTHFGPENSSDSWQQAALTVEGKFGGGFDLVYAGAFLKRNIASIADYSDYSLFYDRYYGSGAFWVGDHGNPIMPQEFVYTKGAFQKWSNEIRLTTPADKPVRATVGLFIQRQLHNIWEQYVMPGYGWTDPYGNSLNPDGFAQSLSIPTLYNTIWLTDEQRVDRDKAAFGEVTWDITSQLSVTGGLRYYKYENSLEGFYGFSLNYNNKTGYSSGMIGCFGPPVTAYAPCMNLNNTTDGSGTVPRANVTYKFTPDVLVYATYSKGFRPGGVNRTSVKGVGPYQADYLKNYEFGWKTEWFDRHLRWNGALFWQDWNNFQFSFLGPNSVNIIQNGASARIKGVETEIQWLPTDRFLLTGGFTWLDPVLTADYCGTSGVTSCPDQVTPNPFLPGGKLIGPQAPAGTNLPLAPKFKGNLVGRYTFGHLGNWEPYAQGSFVYQTQTSAVLRVDQSHNVGTMPAWALIDLTAGANYNNLTFEVFCTNVADRRAQMTRFVATNAVVDNQAYIVPSQPRTIGIKVAQRF